MKLNDNDKKGIEFIIGCFFVICTLPFSYWLGAYTLQSLWEWFFVPLGLPVIGMLHACGISLTISYFSGVYRTIVNTAKEGTAAAAINYVVVNFCCPLFALLAGYILHRYM